MQRDFLNEIIAYKKQLLKEKKTFLDNLKRTTGATKMTAYRLFKEKISGPGSIRLIAEIKKASPSRGLIRQNFDIMQLARTYVESGAAAISVLTEDKFFLGKVGYLKKVSDNFKVPVLRKDFIIDEGQVFEAFHFGASAILLIVAILDDKMLKSLMAEAARLDMDCLVEVHTEEELQRALGAGAEIIGINHRDLHTFSVDLKVSERLIPRIPKGKIIVAESGIETHKDVEYLQGLGAHAVLVGESFLREKDVARKIKEIMQGAI